MSERESEIRSLLRDDVIREIARYCKTPHSSEEIINRIMQKHKSTNRDTYETIVADDLNRMEKAKLITFENGKWKTLEITIRILEKYFGG